ncbi:MAG: SdiA-regulated domain-containing protein [Chitinophagaceae bacterium]
MMQYKSIIPLLISFPFIFFSCTKGGNNEPPQEKEYEEFNTEVSGFSGLCYGPNNTSFYAVSDKYGIYELRFDGSTKRKLPFTGINDFEAITINRTTGRIYLADEALMNIYFLSSDEQSINLVTNINVPGGVSNKGIEGLTYGRDTLYTINQESPTILIKYSLASQTEVSRTQVSFALYLSDIFFDASDNTLWICDSQQKKIFHCNLGGEVIASQAIDYVPKAEALVIDRIANVAWVGCDQTAKLFRIKLSI